MKEVLTRKTWHEMIDDEDDFVLASYGVKYLIEKCILSPRLNTEDYETFCRGIIYRGAIPDEFSYNDILRILHDYLHDRWEEYINGKDSAAD